MNARLVFATSNAHKVSELEAILAPAWEGFEAGCVARMSDFDVASPVEDGVTFEENSLIKARALLAPPPGGHRRRLRYHGGCAGWCTRHLLRALVRLPRG